MRKKSGPKLKAGDRYRCGKLKSTEGAAVLHRIQRGPIPDIKRGAENMAVYVMAAGGMVKIGRSLKPAGRARDIQVGQHVEIRMFWAVRLIGKDAMALELSVHQRLKKLGMHERGEWFNLRPETAVGFIKAAIDRLGFSSHPDPQFGIREFSDPEDDDLTI